MPTPKKTRTPTPFGRLVERRRTELGLSQVELSKMLGYSDSYISQIERGRMPSLKTLNFLDRWANALQISKETLIAEGQLEKHNPVQPASGDLSPARRLLLAVTAHLSDAQVERLARGVREQYGEPNQGPASP